MRLFSLLLCLTTTTAVAEELIVSQKDKRFSTKEIVAKVGDKVSFLNEDPFYHNIFSISDTHIFDLGSYPQGETRSIILEKAGDIEVECAIHPTMRMKIHVTK